MCIGRFVNNFTNNKNLIKINLQILKRILVLFNIFYTRKSSILEFYNRWFLSVHNLFYNDANAIINDKSTNAYNIIRKFKAINPLC